MHSLFCITSWLPYITLCYIDSRLFLPLEQSRTALLGCRLAASRLREAARWQLSHIQTNINKHIVPESSIRFILSCQQEYKMMMQNY